MIKIEKTTKNVLVVSFGFLLLFTAFGGLQSIQSSLNSDQGLGLASLSVIYAALILSSMFLPPLMIKYLGCKWTIVISMCCYVSFSIGNFYPSWYTLIPTAIILGTGGAPLWSAKCTYLTICGYRYAKKHNKIGENIVNHYFGIFFLIFQSSAVWGNLLSSLIFQYTSGKGVGVGGVILVALFLDQLDQDEVKHFKGKDINIWSVLVATFTQLKDKRQCLLIVMTMYSGFEQGFLAGDYTKAYVTCTIGIQYVGYVMICFGASNSIFSAIFGRISRFTGRMLLFAFATITNLSSIIALFLWHPQLEQMAVFFVFPCLWGMADAVWQTQTNAIYGVLFLENKEAAFANYRLWESVGFVTAFAYANFLCITVKLIILVIVLILGMALYGVVEYIEYVQSRNGEPYTISQILRGVYLRAQKPEQVEEELKEDTETTDVKSIDENDTKSSETKL
ncbi:protein unc-93 homolog A-like isoform X2 [Scyliorhinus canicula]|uniref:protein unc-93 homolog A-like isoform X2 n=1 Tax=Scyliorhinus canicula TaxID=7830 RepID=UPI0018F4D4A3|nr:protein unc-93 homolog A-like isoform X2 [Scyliorhinus canicula]